MRESLAMQRFDHFLLTRFNTAIEGRLPPSDEWLRERLALFKKTLLPSLRAQSCASFRWLIFCADDSPAWFRAQLTNAVGALGEPVWVTGSFSPETVAAEVGSRTATPYLITTRIDNDDAVSSGFVERIQERFAYQSFAFLNFMHGLQYEDGWLYRRSDPSNAFCSLIERRTGGQPRTVFLDWHTRIASYGPVDQVRSQPVWMQIVHGGNLANRARGIRCGAENARDFVVDLPVRKAGAVRLALDMVGDAVKLGWRVIQRPHRIAWLWKVARR